MRFEKYFRLLFIAIPLVVALIFFAYVGCVERSEEAVRCRIEGFESYRVKLCIEALKDVVLKDVRIYVESQNVVKEIYGENLPIRLRAGQQLSLSIELREALLYRPSVTLVLGNGEEVECR